MAKTIALSSEMPRTQSLLTPTVTIQFYSTSLSALDNYDSFASTMVCSQSLQQPFFLQKGGQNLSLLCSKLSNGLAYLVHTLAPSTAPSTYKVPGVCGLIK